jgi:hypothetical protein
MYRRNFGEVCKLIAERVNAADEETQASFVGRKGCTKTRTQRNYCNYEQRGERCKVADPRKSKRRREDELDDEDLEWQPTDRLLPLSYDAFWDAIKRKGGEGLRIKHVKQVTGACPHCSRLDALEAEYLRLQGEHDADKTKLAEVWYKLTQARLHRQFWTHQRPFSQHLKAWMVENKEKEDVKKTCLVYQDYGKFYASDGSKVKDLCFVICSLNEFGELTYQYVDNLFRGGSDSSSTIAIWESVMDATELFDKFDTIYLSGDTGNGFRGYDVAAFLSTWKARWGKRVVQCFLCPRHAYSLCDAHFGHLYELIHTQKVQGWLISEEDYQQAIEGGIDAGQIKNTQTFAWTELRDSKPSNVSRGQFISGVTHLEYPDGDGWALVRTVSGSGPWRLMKLFKSHRWKHDFCKNCSLALNTPTKGHGEKGRCPFLKRGVAKSQGNPRDLEDAIAWVPPHADRAVVDDHISSLKKNLDVYRIGKVSDLDPDKGEFFVVNNGQVPPAPTWSVCKILERCEGDGQAKVHWYGSSKVPKKDKHRLKKQVKLNGVCVCVRVSDCMGGCVGVNHC